MKKILFVGAILMGATSLYGAKYQDGTYRGFFNPDVAIEFQLKEDVITSAKYRGLSYKGTDYLKNEKAEIKTVKDQYEALLTYAMGKNVDDVMKAMYTPGNIEKAGATVRGTKVRAAIKNGLIHDVYALPKTK
ncbi:MAG: hypothetical protein ACRCTS_00790 [Fusobacteriaceae bacterium]